MMMSALAVCIFASSPARSARTHKCTQHIWSFSAKQVDGLKLLYWGVEEGYSVYKTLVTDLSSYSL